MTEEDPQRTVVTGIEWDRVFQFRHLGRALSLSFQPGRVIMGFIIIVILMATGSIWDGVAGPNVGPGGLATRAPGPDDIRVTIGHIATDPSLVGTGFAQEAADASTIDPVAVRRAIESNFRSLDAATRADRLEEFQSARAVVEASRPRGTFEATVDYVTDRFAEVTGALLQLDAARALSSLLRNCVELPRLLWNNHPWFFVIFGAWSLLVLLVGYCAIARSAACQFALEQYLAWTDVLAYALKRWLPLAGTVILPLIALGIGVVALAIGGLLLSIPGLNIAGAVLYALALVGGLLAAFIIVLWIVSCGLFVPAVAVESADAPDALSRAFSYVRNRPLHWILYVLIALVLGALGLVIIEWIAMITLNFTAAGASLITDAPSLRAMHNASMTSLLGHDTTWQLTGSHRVAASILMIWRTIVAGLVAGWVIAFDSCACTVIYFLMRKATDGQDLEEIWQPGLIEGTMAPDRAAVPPAAANAESESESEPGDAQ